MLLDLAILGRRVASKAYIGVQHGSLRLVGGIVALCWWAVPKPSVGGRHRSPLLMGGTAALCWWAAPQPPVGGGPRSPLLLGGTAARACWVAPHPPSDAPLSIHLCVCPTGRLSTVEPWDS